MRGRSANRAADEVRTQGGRAPTKSEPSGPWRLVLSRPADGPWNMAADEAIMREVSHGESPPTVRLYSWEKPCVSLGYAQRGVDALAGRCAAAGVGLVRRITGGRAVLHDLEIAYSVAAPLRLGNEFATIPEAYRFLSGALRLALEKLGLPGDGVPEQSSQRCAPSPPRRASGAMCFALTIGGDVRVGNAKVAGSAQARKEGVLLQQGSVLLGVNWALQGAIFGPEAELVRAGGLMAGVRELGLGDTSEQQVEQALVEGFTSILGPLLEGPLTAREQALTCELELARYGSEGWNRRGRRAGPLVDVSGREW